MRVAVPLIFAALVCPVVPSVLSAQIVQPAVPLELEGKPRPTQLPRYVLMDNPECDSGGNVYVRYAASDSDNNATSSVARIESDGSTKTIKLDAIPGSNGQTHAFTFATADDSSLHLILRAPVPGHDTRTDTSQIEYVRFDSDGELRSAAAFGDEFIPSVLIPLPSGNFFAAGVSLKPATDGVAEFPQAGIFSSDAKLQLPLKKDPKLLRAKEGSTTEEADAPEQISQTAVAKLGDDGNIYLLMAGDRARIAVVNQSGRIVRTMSLPEPFENGVPHDMWVSGNRLLLVYEGETDDPKDAFLYVTYDLQTSRVIRVYHPEFEGTPACFQDGQTLSVLVRQQAAGTLAIATTELQ